MDTPLYVVGMRRALRLLGWVGFLAVSLSTVEAASARVIKVLPHYLDLRGRNSLAPSLYERDAYQARLREHPDERSALRYDVQWKGRASAGGQSLTLRLELRGSRSHTVDPLVIERKARPRRWFSQWSALTLTEEAFQDLGEVVAWRVSVVDGDRALAEQRSFLW